VKRLPAHAHLRYQDIRIIVQKLFESPSRRKLQGIKAGNSIGRAEDRNSSLSVKRIAPSSTMSARNWRVADDVAFHIEHIGILIQCLPAPLATDGKAHTPSRQVKEFGCVYGGIQRGQL